MAWPFRHKIMEPTDNEKRQATIEIVAHKEAKAKVIKQAKQANKQLNDLLVENGFTLKIYLAAGGKAPQQKQTKKGT